MLYQLYIKYWNYTSLGDSLLLCIEDVIVY